MTNRSRRRGRAAGRWVRSAMRRPERDQGSNHQRHHRTKRKRVRIDASARLTRARLPCPPRPNPRGWTKRMDDVATAKHPHPWVFLALVLPFGASTGYVTVTLAFLLAAKGATVAAIGALAA